ncbi:MAG: hypothetical protein ABI634_02650 [Acidobacteriota bacterium]
MSELMLKVLKGLIGVLLVPITNWLVSKGILSSNETTQLVAEVVSYVVVILGAIVVTVKQHRRERTALAMKPGSTPTDLTEQIKSGASAPLMGSPDIAPRIAPKLAILLAVALSASLALPACSTFQPPASVTTTQGQNAFRADVAVQRLGELQTVVIAANRQGLLADATATRIVQFTVGSIKTLKETPDGWRATVSTGWASLKSVLPPTTGNVSAALNAVDLALALIGGGQ